MVDQKKYSSGVPVIIAIIAALITGQIVRSYDINLLPGTLITIAVAVVLWYGFNFFKKRKNK
ncbi:UNVERIFIED_ORG: hypothetical protein ABRZ91_001908 [Heyndrickxia coagulans]